MEAKNAEDVGAALQGKLYKSTTSAVLLVTKGAASEELKEFRRLRIVESLNGQDLTNVVVVLFVNPYVQSDLDALRHQVNTGTTDVRIITFDAPLSYLTDILLLKMRHNPYQEEFAQPAKAAAKARPVLVVARDEAVGRPAPGLSADGISPPSPGYDNVSPRSADDFGRSLKTQLEQFVHGFAIYDCSLADLQQHLVDLYWLAYEDGTLEGVTLEQVRSVYWELRQRWVIRKSAPISFAAALDAHVVSVPAANGATSRRPVRSGKVLGFPEPALAGNGKPKKTMREFAERMVNVDSTNFTADARRLFPDMQKEGIEGTLASLGVALGVAARKQRAARVDFGSAPETLLLTPVPASDGAKVETSLPVPVNEAPLAVPVKPELPPASPKDGAEQDLKAASCLVAADDLGALEKGKAMLARQLASSQAKLRALRKLQRADQARLRRRIRELERQLARQRKMTSEVVDALMRCKKT